ncbi:hypothetical protein [Polaromonas sp. SM01]|nr:hypothetical protein [Polaromonas sp. SM01]MDW5442833.1 hypothetical protein [Polaromonas sp. SM01]
MFKIFHRRVYSKPVDEQQDAGTDDDGFDADAAIVAGKLLISDQ